MKEEIKTICKICKKEYMKRTEPLKGQQTKSMARRWNSTTCSKRCSMESHNRRNKKMNTTGVKKK